MNNKQEKLATYESLEQSIPNFTDYIDTPVVENNEPLVALPKDGMLVGIQYDFGTKSFIDTPVLVRRTVRERLFDAAEVLQAINSELSLDVGYGYRKLSVQREKYEQQLKRLSSQYNDVDQLRAAAHRFVAIPEAAGHPTGGAVDITIQSQNGELDFGTKRWDLMRDSYVFSPYIDKNSRQNRLLLREVMARVGFAPFDGEWWHFSYGDKEWAYAKGNESALYTQFNSV